MKNSRTNNSIKNISASLIYQIINFVLSFVSRTVFLQVLGVEYLGISGLFNDVLSMLNLAELGFGTAMTYGMYKPLAEKDYDTLAGLTCFYKKIYRIIAFSIALIGVILVPFLPYIVNLEQDIANLELYYLLFLASNVASYLVTYKTTVMYADQKNYILLKYGSYWNIAKTIVLTLILYLTRNYILFLIVQVVMVYASNYFNSYIAQKNYPFIGKKVVLSKEKKVGIFKDVGSAFIYKIANVILTATDNTLISVIVSTSMVGYYSNYQIITSKLSSIIGTFFTSLITSIGNLIAKEKEEQRFQVFQIMQIVCLMISNFFVTCVFLLEEDFIRVWLGEDYILGMFALITIIINFYFVIIIKPITAFKEAAGLFRKTKFIMLWNAALNLSLSIVMGINLGLPGILLATSISKLLTSFWYEPKILFEEYFNISSRVYFKDIFKGIIITLVTILITWIGSSCIIPTGWVELIFKGIVVVAISLSLTVLFYCRTEGFTLLISKGKSIVSGLKK